MAESELPIRVLHLTAASDTGGMSRYIYDLCSAMHDRGHLPMVAGERGSWHDLFEQAPWPWIESPNNGGPLSLWCSSRILRRYLTDHPVDIVHAHFRKASIVGRRLSRTTGIPLLFTLHLSHIPMNGYWRWLSDFGDHTHAVSDEARQWLTDVAGLPGDRVTVINNGIDIDRYQLASEDDQALARQSFGLEPDSLVAAYAGRLDYPKNVDWLLDLASKSKSRLPKLRILIAGDGPDEQNLRHRVEREGLTERIHLLGYRDPLSVYHAADALLLPSGREGFGLSCAEAMSVGRPVLRTQTSGTKAMIVEGETGRSVPIDKNAFIDAAMEFLQDRQALIHMGHQASKYVAKRLTSKTQVDQTIDLYRRLIMENREQAN